jgi:serine protease Do
MLSNSRNICIKILIFVVCFYSAPSQADSNIEFLDKKTIKILNNNLFEIVIPKLESKKIEYARELPFHKLSFKERNEKYHSIGTAFFISSTKLMSAAHVFGLHNFSLYNDAYIRNGEGKVYKIKMIHKYSTIRDVVVFDLEKYPKSITPLKFTEKSDIGDTVFSIGNAQGEGISFRAGQIASFTVEPEYGKWKDVRFTSPASPGNSGGPLVNMNGQVVGLIVKKNASENHNVALPSSELKNVKPSAVFHIKNLAMVLNDDQNIISGDWTQSFELPKSIGELSELSQSSLNEFYKKLIDELNDKYKDLAFPRGKRFRAFLKEQNFIRQFGVLKTDADFKEWSINNYSSSNIALEKDQNLILSKSDISSFHVIIDKPEGVSLNDFVSNPKLVMDNILKGMPITRAIGEEKIRITSLGEPEKIESWTDKLGRKWLSSLWFMPHNNVFLYNHCLAYPKGSICNMDIKYNNELYYGYLYNLKESYNEIAIGYEGKVTDWLEYFSLDRKFRPMGMESSKMKLDGELFEFDILNYSLKFDNSEINKQSNIHLHFGYSNTELLAEDLLLFEIFPKNGVKFHYRVQKYHSPSDFSDDEFKSRWSDINSKEGDFSGKIINKDGRFSVQKVIENTKIFEKNDKTMQSLYVVRCISNASRDNIESDCGSFANSVKFNVN